VRGVVLRVPRCAPPSRFSQALTFWSSNEEDVTGCEMQLAEEGAAGN